MEKIPFDNFIINLDVSGNIGFSTGILLEMLLNNVKKNVHIINYTALDIKSLIDGYSSDDKTNDPNIEKKIIVAMDTPMNFVSIEAYAKKLGADDYLFVVGGERLISFSDTPAIIKTKFNDLTRNLHFMESGNWNHFANEIDKLYGDMQNDLLGIFFNVFIDLSSRDLVLSLIEKSDNFSITCIEVLNQDENYELLQRDLFSKFEGSSLAEIFTMLKKNKDKLDNNTYIYMTALTYMQHGDFTKSVETFESNYDNLRNEEKLILADLLISINSKKRAEQILNELFKVDKYQRGLIQSILRLHNDNSNSSKKKDWIEIGMELDPLNPVVLEHYGNWLSNSGDYLGAAKIFREIRDMMDSSPYYELVARVNDLFNSPQKSTVAESYINNVLEGNPELKNEAKYRLARYLIENKGSFYTAYSVLKETDFKFDKPRVIEIAKLKLDILEDVVTGSAAMRKLKPFEKLRDANLLREERTNVLLESIPILATSANGYLTWRSFIANSQLDDTWKKSILFQLKTRIPVIFSKDFSKILEQSYIKNFKSESIKSEVYEGILLLRKVKSGEFSIEEGFDNIEEFIDVILTVSELYGDINSKLWSRYYLSIILGQLGETQLANNIALSIFEYYPRIKDYQLKKMCVYLGLIAWGNSQYRLGREVEGIICVISASQLAGELNEYLPLVEEGVNIIARFLSDNRVLINEGNNIWIKEFSESLSEHNTSLNHMSYFINNKSSLIISELENEIKSSQFKDLEWAGKIVNLIAAYMENSQEDEAFDLLENYGEETLELLSSRIDIRYRIILSWSQIYFNKANKKCFTKSLVLLEKAIEDIEKHRSKVYHKEERSSVGSSAQKIYRFYIQVCSLLFGLSDTSESEKKDMERKLKGVFQKISLRSIIEQKNYNVTNVVTKDMEQLVERKKILTEEYNNLFQENSDDIDLINYKVEEIENITKVLINEHPHFKPLPYFQEIDFNEIQTNLENGEVFYQYVVTPLTVVTLLITKDSIDFKTKLISSEAISLEELSKLFSRLIQDDEEYEDEIKVINENISHAIAEELIRYVTSNKTSRVYLMQDYNMGLFPLLISNIGDDNLINKVNSIINVIDYSLVGNRNKSENKNGFFKVLNRVVGKPTDTSLKIIDEWLKKSTDDSFMLIENNSDNFTMLSDLTASEDITTVIIYGHGVPDPQGSLIDGAQGIEGQKKLIRIEDIINQLHNVKNLILISCRGGSPYSGSHENSTGTWAAMLENFKGNIISCKWDVPTKSSIFIINEMMEQIKYKNVNIDEALILAQRKAREHYGNPMYWGGIEFWKN